MQEIDRLEKDQHYMKIALDLAKRGIARVSPNPLVGAVIVKDDQIIGKGYHEKYGGLHAERNAIKDYKNRAINDPNLTIEGATMYVTLEPCCHYGKTPPCTEAIIENKIKRVVVASLDPNPLVAGKGVKILEEVGIEVDIGVLKDEADRQNRIFRHYIKNKRPLVTMKYAMTMDGKLATHTGKSKWITGHDARRRVHLERLRNMAIMVGVGTVLADDPSLNCRLEDFDGFDKIKKDYSIEGLRNPIRVVVDSSLRTPFNSKIVTSAKDIKTIIFTISEDMEKIRAYEDRDCIVIKTKKKLYRSIGKKQVQIGQEIQMDQDGHKYQEYQVYQERQGERFVVDLEDLVEILGQMGIDSILLEGGSQLNFSALESGIVDRVQAYIGPKIFGGEKAKSPIGGIGVDLPEDAYMLENIEFDSVGKDILLEGDLVKCSQG